MEVQALFTPNHTRKAPRLAVSAVAPFFHFHDANRAGAQEGSLPGCFPPQQQVFVNGATVFSGDPVSELTYNGADGSRKRRAIDGDVARAMLQGNNLQEQQRQPAHDPREVVVAPMKAAACGSATSPLDVANDKIRLNDSGMTSTSGRPPVGTLATAISPVMEQLALQFYCQSLEIDAFIRLQNEEIRSGLGESLKRHHRVLLALMGQGVLDRLREREAELESASRRNAELEEKIRQLASENQIWFNVARSKEAIVSSLRATIEQVLLQNLSGVPGGAGVEAAVLASQEAEEGYGETDWAAPAFPADDAQSCCNEGAFPSAAGPDEHDTAAARGNPREVHPRSACRVCGKREASVVLLPCRHLSLCKQCAAGVDACPVCNVAKNASLQVFMC